MKPLCGQLSLGFSYAGLTDLGTDRLWDVEVQQVHNGVPAAWTPPGVWFSVSQERECFHLMLSTVPGLLPEGFDQAFLDRVGEELSAG
jgi:hypothetical protein